MPIVRRPSVERIDAPAKVVRAGAFAICAGVALSAAPGMLATQAATPGLTGTDHAEDVVTARQLLMASVEAEMLAIDLASGGRKVEFSILQSRAYTISTFLTAFPHLFPPETRPGPAADGSPSATAATAAIWEDFENFYGRAQEAAAVAYDASQAADLDHFMEPAKKLREACDSCHAQYMQVQ